MTIDQRTLLKELSGPNCSIKIKEEAAGVQQIAKPRMFLVLTGSYLLTVGSV